MSCIIRRAEIQDLPVVSEILQEAAAWLRDIRQPLWRDDEARAEAILPDVESGLFHLAVVDGTAGGTIKFQLEDPELWPDVPHGMSAFLHRLAVRRQFSGGALSRDMLDWAVRRAQQCDREFLRLDCDAARPKLRAVYERFGFTYHSDFQHGSYHVARYELRVTAIGSPGSNLVPRKQPGDLYLEPGSGTTTGS
jgi:GNAT superfamily N-acetyltransferase